MSQLCLYCSFVKLEHGKVYFQAMICEKKGNTAGPRAPRNSTSGILKNFNIILYSRTIKKFLKVITAK